MSKTLEKINEQLLVDTGQSFTISVQPASTGVNMKKLSLQRLQGVYNNRDGADIKLKEMNIKNIEYAFSVKKLNYYIGFSKEKN